MLGMSLSPCRPYHPVGVRRLVSQSAPAHAAFTLEKRARPPRLYFSGPPVGSLPLRPGDSLTILKMALSVGFIGFVSSTSATQATGL